MNRRRLMMGGKGAMLPGEVLSTEALACDVVFASNKDGSLHIIRNQSDWPNSGYTPIGIVVIPGEHNVYGNGTCGVMSLKSMSYSDPDNGATSERIIHWGGYGTDISGLTNYNRLITTSSNTTNTVSGGLSDGTVAYLPVQAAVNGTPTRNNSPYAPSPYVGKNYKSGGHNALYSTTALDSGSEHNVLADFDGIDNTKIITDLATTQSNWKTDSSITNDGGDGYYPVACCCARYKTVGTKSFKDCTTTEIGNGTGFWYLPAAGELGYIMPRFYDINATIAALRTKYGNTVGVQLNTRGYWSSSESTSNSTYYMITGTGVVYTYSKNSSNYVRAFLRL